ncbi:MAG: hypothetical protein HOK30_24565, partial [Rhodospirillaceae bacterium]|nr:hypothetical protein [Rhodospirillaceae bacterium]
MQAAAIAVCVFLGADTAVQAQQIIVVGDDFANEAQAVEESVGLQRRETYQPHGVRLGQFLGLTDDLHTTESVADQQPKLLRPGEKPGQTRTGLRYSGLDSFLLRPKMEVDMLFDDNIFRTEEDADTDRIYIFRPEVTLESDCENGGDKLVH